MATHFVDGLFRIFGISNSHRVRTENGWEQDGKHWRAIGNR